MPDIRKLRKAVQPDEFLELLPTLEELLTHGTKLERKRYADKLNERAEGDEVLAFTLAGGGKFGFEHDDPDLWRELEKEGKLSEVIAYWNKAQTYRYWARVLNYCPVTTLQWYG
jgi:hypothetical protein